MQTFSIRRVIAPVLAMALTAAACSSNGTSSSTSDSGAKSEANTSEVTDAAPTSSALAAAPTGSVDQELLAKQLEVVTFPSDKGAAMIAVMDSDGSTVYASKGSDPVGSAPEPSSAFRIGSITKTFTAILVLTLVDDGLVDLDAPASSYVSRMAVPDDVAVRDLLQHTSGIPNYTDAPGFFDRALDDAERRWEPEETYAEIDGMEPLFEPGARFSYSNTNYLVLGVLVEEVTGHSYAEELRERVIEPLGLNSTYLAGAEDGPAPFGAYSSMSGAIEPVDFDYTSIATDAWAAGAIVSSAQDLHVLLTALFEGQLISSDSLAAMTKNEEYGLGLAQLEPGVYGHNGSIPGYFALVGHAPATGSTAFFTLTNDGVPIPPSAEPVFDRISNG